ncbi:MAG: hypothetical protein ACE5IY_17070 [bacterium]
MIDRKRIPGKSLWSSLPVEEILRTETLVLKSNEWEFVLRMT